MMSFKVCLHVLGFITVILLPSIATGQTKTDAKPIELRLAHMMPASSPHHRHLENWAAKIAADSGGRLKVRIFPANTLLPGPEIYDGVKNGAVDLGYSWRYKPTGFDIGGKFAFILNAPDTVTGGVLYDEIWAKFPREMENEWKDVKVLYLVPSVPNYLASTKSLSPLDSIKGQQLRVASNELGTFVRQLGGTPAFMSHSDFIIGLDKGTVNGGGLLSVMVVDYKLGGKLKSIIMDPVGLAGPVFLAMNKDSYSKLPDDLKNVIDKSCEQGKKDGIKYFAALQEETTKYFKASNMEMIYLKGAEKQMFEEVYASVRQQVGKDLDAKGYPGTEIVRFITERVKHYSR
ncbi:MAG: hypothetical protein C4576_07355 [Desulfobacteraceae bacterium]|nr:MAG: hypothetical protein C4576_07355 [Desulfobacteraceae bacterium]